MMVRMKVGSMMGRGDKGEEDGRRLPKHHRTEGLDSAYPQSEGQMSLPHTPASTYCPAGDMLIQ